MIFVCYCSVRPIMLVYSLKIQFSLFNVTKSVSKLLNNYKDSYEFIYKSLNILLCFVQRNKNSYILPFIYFPNKNLNYK